MRRLVGLLLLPVVLLPLLLGPGPTADATGTSDDHAPPFTLQLPATTTQVIRTITSHRWCAQIYCTVTQAWSRDASGAWVMEREFRSTIGSAGWGKTRENDRKSPVGVLRITITFSTTTTNPGRMPWRPRLPTSIVTDWPGKYYNTWIEQRGRTDGTRPAMRWGLVIDYNHPRMRVGVGPAPVQGKGDGIFMHTSKPGHLWAATLGCTQVGDPDDMHWLLTWLRPGANPRIVQDL